MDKFNVVGKKIRKNFFKEGTNTINPLVRKLIKEGKKLNIPSNYIIDKKNKTVIKIANKDGFITPKYKQSIIETPQNLVPNKNQKFIYNYTDDKLVERKEYLTKSNKLTQLSKSNNLKYENGVLVLSKVSKFKVGEKIGSLNGLSNSRIYQVEKKANGDYKNEPPNNIKDFIDTIKYHYKNDFSTQDRKRKSQRVLLKFGSELRYIPISALNRKNLGDDFNNWSKFKIGNKKIGSDVSFGDNQNFINEKELDLTYFRIVFRGTIEGGANRLKCETKFWKTNQPPTTGNLCLEGALNRGLNLNKTAKTLRRDISNYYNGEIDLDDMVELQNINMYEDYLDCSINIYEDLPHQDGNLLLESKTGKSKTVDILLKNSHYYLITGKKFQLNQLSNNDKSKLGITKKLKVPAEQTVKKSSRELLCIFDIETVFDRDDNNYLKSYGVSWFIWDATEKFNYENGWNADRTVNKYHNPPFCYYEKGYGCLKTFINFLMKPPKNCVYKPLGFNNSRFDNFAYCEEALNMGVLRDVFFADGTILFCSIENTRPSWDASRFLTGLSLDKACKSYNTNPKKRTDLIDHYEIQTYFEKTGWDGLMKLIDDKPTLELYNKIDCICLLDLVLKMRNCYSEMFDFDIFESYTLSSMSYKILTEKWSDSKTLKAQLNGVKCKIERRNITKNHIVPHTVNRAENYEIDKFWRNSLTAGRTQSFYDRITVDIPLSMVDVKSLYPTVLGSYGGNDCPFPYGHYSYTETEIKDKLGIYRVTINHQRCKWKYDKMDKQFDLIKNKYGYDLKREYAPNVIPRRTEDMPLDWFYKGKIENIHLTSTDIEVLRNATEDFDCVTVYEGYYWSDKSTKLFYSFLDPPKKEKTKQDKLKAERKKIENNLLGNRKKTDLNSEEKNKLENRVFKKMYKEFGEDYNEAKREGSKGVSNSVSGKLLEAIHPDITTLFSCRKFIDMEKDDKIKDLEILDFGNNFAVITGSKNCEDVFNSLKDKKPSHLGMFCYSYARRLMYEKILSKYIVLYMDTDSACMPLEEYDRMNNDEENIETDLMDNGEYGCLEEEVCDMIYCEECKEREERNDRTEIKEYRKNNIMINGLRCEKCKFIPADKLIAISPKNYLVENSKNQKLSKRKFKGVRRNDFWLPLSYFGEYEKKERIRKDGSVVNYIEGEAYDNVTGMTQEEIRRFREFKCCENCIQSVINCDETDYSGCEECNKKKSIMKKTYSTEMFEYMVKGEKIAVFCSMINRIKYNIKDIVDWEFTDKIENGNLQLKDFEYIMKNHKEGINGKNPVCLRFNLDEEETKEYYRKMEIEYNRIMNLNNDKKEKDKLFNKWFVDNRKFKNCNEERELLQSFKLKQVFMIKII